MAGRTARAVRARLPPRHASLEDRRNAANAAPFPRSITRPAPLPAVYEEELQLRLEEIRRLTADNRRLLVDRIALQCDLRAAEEEIHRLNVAIREIRAELEAETEEMVERELNMESELRDIETLRKEVQELRAEIPKLNKSRQEQVQGLRQDLAWATSEVQQLTVLKAEADVIRQELHRARTLFEYEKKRNVFLVEQKQTTENNVASMVREVEQVRAELNR